MKKYIISGLVALALVVSVGTTARAEGQVTIAELQAQIKQLMSLLQTLLAQQSTVNNTSSNTPPAPVVGQQACVSIDRTLAIGNDGNDVKNLQQFLADKGYLELPDSTGKPTGYFGSMTKAAITKWQREQGMTPDGFLNMETRSKINLLRGCEGGTQVTPGAVGGGGGSSNPPKAVVPNPVQTCKIDKNLYFENAGDDIKDLQNFLIKNGYSSGVSNTTGTYGVNTKIGVEAFQRAKGITGEDGVGERTRAAMNTLINCDGGTSITTPTVPNPTPVSLMSVKVITPNGGDTYHVGDSVNINFTTNLTEANSSGIALQLYRYKGGNGFPYEFVSTIKSGNRESYNWTIPTLPSGQYVIYAVGENVMANGASIGDFSDKPFTILPVGAAGGANVISSLGSLLFKILDF